MLDLEKSKIEESLLSGKTYSICADVNAVAQSSAKRLLQRSV
jgi:hypothetical protein